MSKSDLPFFHQRSVRKYDLGARSSVLLVAPNDIEEHAQDDGASVHHARIVHRLRCHWNRRREEGENDGDQRISGGKHIDGHPPPTQVPGSKVDGLGLSSSVDHTDNGDEIRREVARNDERYNRVESDRRADVDEAEEGVDGTGKADGPKWNGKTLVNLKRRISSA